MGRGGAFDDLFEPLDDMFKEQDNDQAKEPDGEEWKEPDGEEWDDEEDYDDEYWDDEDEDDEPWTPRGGDAWTADDPKDVWNSVPEDVWRANDQDDNGWDACEDMTDMEEKEADEGEYKDGNSGGTFSDLLNL